MSIKKRALLVGVSYEGTDMELKGTKNDTIRLREKLIAKFGYKSEDIEMLIEHIGYKPPTRNNILNALIKLIIASRRGEIQEVFFSYSGHGTSIQDRSGDEADDMDECLVPLDYQRSGLITDDILAHYFKYFSSRCRSVVLFDCCHSGSLADLRYEINVETGENVTVSENPKCRAPIIYISGCRDFECSLDVVHSEFRSWGGALCFSILEILDDTKDADITWHELVKKSREYMIKHGYPQRPQLSCSKVLSEDTKVCVSHDGGVTFDFEI